MKRLIGATVKTMRTVRTGVRTAPRVRPPMDPDVRAALTAHYADDRRRTAALLGWDDWA